jgi:hypothetical protein
MLEPCQNSGTCINDNTDLGYTCLCLSGFDGTECEIDNRICQSDTCWNNGKLNIEKKNDEIIYFILGTCYETSNTTFSCTCAAGWQNSHCELIINYYA